MHKWLQTITAYPLQCFSYFISLLLDTNQSNAIYLINRSNGSKSSKGSIL